MADARQSPGGGLAASDSALSIEFYDSRQNGNHLDCRAIEVADKGNGIPLGGAQLGIQCRPGKLPRRVGASNRPAACRHTRQSRVTEASFSHNGLTLKLNFPA
jgi:hypothetical protein